MNNVVEILQDNNINAREYKKGPLGNRQFAISILNETSEGTVMYWQGGANVEVLPDKKYRQAVLSVQEDAHPITKTLNVPWMSTALNTPERINRWARENFNVVVPRKTRFRIVPHLEEIDSSAGRHLEGTIDITAYVPGFHQDLLVGFDEKYHFISELPRKADSVETAHRILRPTDVPAETKRMGEWFFVPMSPVFAKVLDNYAMDATHVESRRLEPGSSHSGRQVMRYRNNLYAVGYVFDSRSTHHTPLYLEDWHKVVRNRETVTTPRRRTQPLRRYWD